MKNSKKSAKFYIIGFLLLMSLDTFAQISFKNASAVVEPFVINDSSCVKESPSL